MIAAATGVRLAVRLTPKGGVDRIDGIGLDAAGRTFVRARVAAPPEGGRANASLIRLLARALDLAPSRLAIAGGETSRTKQIAITGEPAALRQRLQQWVTTLHDRPEDH
ncbi:MAG: DUF167 domain-containing protein [Alphaproteobacteria bacterium]|nr:DUF167 domain-containing protein [Alphaproteobacteria bacterium]